MPLNKSTSKRVERQFATKKQDGGSGSGGFGVHREKVVGCKKSGPDHKTGGDTGHQCQARGVKK